MVSYIKYMEERIFCFSPAYPCSHWQVHKPVAKANSWTSCQKADIIGLAGPQPATHSNKSHMYVHNIGYIPLEIPD